jgi:flavin reductase (DIM6/NTAB) family NADH-FMN oxidoreductase RutF
MKPPVPYAEQFPALMEALTTRGLLLGSYGPDGRPNAMTIGWGTLGSVWGLPVWTVLVRPSRHTWAGVERHQAFTVNLPPPALAAACTLFGTLSGRDVDKFARSGLTAVPTAVDAPGIAECALVHACRVVHALDVLPDRLVPKVRSGAYRSGDYHRIYIGEIIEATARPGAGAAEGRR